MKSGGLKPTLRGLTVHRYIELNPVRAAMTPTADGHRWSSARASLALAADSLLTFHPLYLAMGADPIQRGSIYRQWLQRGISEDDLQGIRSHLRQERALGRPRFQTMVEKTLNRPASIRPRGRPRKPEALTET